MAKKDHKAIDLEILASVSELNDYIKEVDLKINDFMMHVNSAKSDDKVKALKIKIRALKKTQEDVKKRFNDFIIKNCQHGNQGINLEMNKSFEDVKVGIEEFKKEEDNVNELMMIQSDKSDDLGKDTEVWVVIKGEEQYVYDAVSGEEKCCDFLGSEIKKFEIQEDYMDKMMKMKQEGTGRLSALKSEEVLEQKMRELVLERKDLLNIDEDDLKKSLMECVKGLSNTRKI